jgi:class 3 adenylate cyclase
VRPTSTSSTSHSPTPRSTSTRKAAEIGDASWLALLERHDELTARHVAAYRGRLIKATGDGVLATFDGPARAIRCACDIRDAVKPLGLSIRSGLHTGEVEVTESDVHGVAVHVAARIAARAGSDEVLVSETVPALVLGSRLEFEPRGSYELKGLPGTWKLLEVTTSA